jgi:hypothetical protein
MVRVLHVGTHVMLGMGLNNLGKGTDRVALGGVYA